MQEQLLFGDGFPAHKMSYCIGRHNYLLLEYFLNHTFNFSIQTCMPEMRSPGYDDN